MTLSTASTASAELPDLSTIVGTVHLKNPVMTASGTAGHGAELARYFDLAALGAVVVKSLSAEPWPGNPAPRIRETAAGMLNSVGLQNPGVEAWLEHELPQLRDEGATVIASIWGFTVEAYEKAAQMLRGAAPGVIVAVEVNLSCPNVEARRDVFAHDEASAAAAIDATGVAGLPRWAKLSPNVTDLSAIATAVAGAGAEAVTLVNTLMGMAIDVERRTPALGRPGGGLSGAAIHPVAVRAAWDVHEADPRLPIVGVGGVTTAADAIELMLAGASAVQVGTATFRDPRAPASVLNSMRKWCDRRGVRRVAELIGAAHGR